MIIIEIYTPTTDAEEAADELHRQVQCQNGRVCKKHVLLGACRLEC